MTIDKAYCMSSFLMYRTIVDPDKTFAAGIRPQLWSGEGERELIHNSQELENSLRKSVEAACRGGRAALALSGGIDSAILAKFMPKGSVAYTFKCVVPGIQVTDETPQAAQYAEACGLEQRVLEVYWEDFEQYAPLLMAHKNSPFHSIEVQIYKAALQAKKDGFDVLIFGETADANYGGFSGLMSKEWTVGEFIDRYSYVLPHHALKDFCLVTEPVVRYAENGYVNAHEFLRDIFRHESVGSYTDACDAAGIQFAAPFNCTWLAEPLDIQRVRNGENKYLVREVFERLYPGWSVPAKLPMPRATNEWLRNWGGPVRPEFWPHCTDPMTGDQKWLVWCLERFLNMIDEERKN